jgi:hypothetical protein
MVLSLKCTVLSFRGPWLGQRSGLNSWPTARLLQDNAMEEGKKEGRKEGNNLEDDDYTAALSLSIIRLN